MGLIYSTSLLLEVLLFFVETFASEKNNDESVSQEQNPLNPCSIGAEWEDMIDRLKDSGVLNITSMAKLIRLLHNSDSNSLRHVLQELDKNKSLERAILSPTRYPSIQLLIQESIHESLLEQHQLSKSDFALFPGNFAYNGAKMKVQFGVGDEPNTTLLPDPNYSYSFQDRLNLVSKEGFLLAPAVEKSLTSVGWFIVQALSQPSPFNEVKVWPVFVHLRTHVKSNSDWAGMVLVGPSYLDAINILKIFKKCRHTTTHLSHISQPSVQLGWSAYRTNPKKGSKDEQLSGSTDSSGHQQQSQSQSQFGPGLLVAHNPLFCCQT